ncbi:hypothetical protein Pcinc_023675, partial [Petrolisthes cinctipes]
LLEKLRVKCPNVDQCSADMQRGDLEDHLKYRCPGNWVSCPHATSGCNYRGPHRSLPAHTHTCTYKDQGVPRPPIVEGEITHLEIPRTHPALGITIVGGFDTPLRCVVVQEVFPDGLVAQDGRLQAGDQIIEVEGQDMTTASHQQVCEALRRHSPVLRIGVYRERIEAQRNLSVPPPSSSSSNQAPAAPSTPSSNPPPSTPSSNPPPSTPSTPSSNPPPSTPVSPNNNNNNNTTTTTTTITSPPQPPTSQPPPPYQPLPGEAMMVTLRKERSRPLGLKLGGRRSQPGIFVMEVLEGSVAWQDGRLHPHDRILAINGADVRYARLHHASSLIHQSHAHVSLVVSRGGGGGGTGETEVDGPPPEYQHLFRRPEPGQPVQHWRTKSAPERLVPRRDQYADVNKSLGDVTDTFTDIMEGNGGEMGLSASCESLLDERRSGQQRSPVEHCSGSLGSLGSLTPGSLQHSNGSLASVGSGLHHSSGSLSSMVRTGGGGDCPLEEEGVPPALPPRHRHALARTPSSDPLELPDMETVQEEGSQLEVSGLSLGSGNSPPQDVADGSCNSRHRSRRSRDSDPGDLVQGLRRSLRIEGPSSTSGSSGNPHLHQKTVTITKGVNESLGMRVGGGLGSNEGDTPIYIANINPQGPVGKSKQVKKGDVVLSVNGQSLLGLTHGQAVALLKATAELGGVTLSLLEGPESAGGAGNFVPSWLYWQKLPRCLHLAKSVVLHRAAGASLGFSIVGGADPQRGPEPIHVLFVVQSSPAALDGKLRCGDRLLSVDGRSLEQVRHAAAVALLKQAGQRVHLQVVSWLGTEL